MGSLGSPQAWVPYDNLKDCSQGFCSLYCPQWCYVNFAPPPPYGYPDDDSSGTNFSPLVIAIIGILASAFLLVSYYTVISKYCGNFDSFRRRGNSNSSDEFNENENPSNLEPWQVSTTGLDEKLIKSITVCKYKKGDGFVEGTDCSVCLSEFQEDESLRLLPKCSHAFHLYCIDTWLKSHSNCPLCRANVVPVSPLPLQLPSPVQPNPSPTQEENIVVAVDELETRNTEEVVPQNDDVHQDDAVAKTPNVENSEARDTIIEVREEGIQPIRRSVSMDASCHDRVSIADILCMSEDEASSLDDQEHHIGIGSSSKLPNVDEHNKYSNRSRVSAFCCKSSSKEAEIIF